ncbi:MAG: sodium/pantothenate symporter [Firmicutes bacterium]|nr:sodium/pantothenate symporter [Bacillota bacterium]
MTSKQIMVLCILSSYLLINLFLGLMVSRKAVKDNAEGGFLQNYFMGNRSMGGLVLAMTLVATYASASSFLGGPGLAANWGLTQVWVAGVQIGSAFLTLGVVGKKFAIISREINAVTVTDYFQARYQSPLVVALCGICLVCFFVTQMVAQFIGGATLIQTVTGLPYQLGLAMFAAIVIIYTSVGGFKAVVITDTFQGIIMAFGTFLMLFFVLKAGGGMEAITMELTEINPGWDLLGKGPYANGNTALSPGYLISYWVLVGVGVLGLPQTAVRGMGFKDTNSMHRAMIYGTVTVGIMMIGMHLAGVLCLPLLPEGGVGTTDQVIPYVVMNYMPGWAAGLFLAAPLAAVMSTVSSLLILASATIIKDLWLSYIAKDREGKGAVSDKKISRYSFLITVVLGLIAFLFAMSPPDIIVWINLFAMGGLEATFFWPLVGGLYWDKGNAKCCIASILVGVSTFVFFNQVKIAPFHVHEIVIALLFGGIAYFVTGIITNKKDAVSVR